MQFSSFFEGARNSMPIVILTVLVQIALIVHVMRTGRAIYWIFIILMVPGIGSVAYFIVELLPDLSNSMGGRRAAHGIRKAINPGADLRQRQLEHQMSGSVDAARHLAQELIENGRYADAIEHFQSALTGIYEHDPDLMLGLAQAQFGNGDAKSCKETLDELKETNPDYRSPEGHLLFARALEQCDDLDKAETEYAAIAPYYPGAEARVRYAQLLERVEKIELARKEYAEIVAAAEMAPAHFRKVQKKWIAEARSGVSRLG
jgi:hypothetical protein